MELCPSMKVIIITNNYPRKNQLFSGIFIHLQAKALQQLGVECHVLQLYNWYPPMGLHQLHGYWQAGYKAKQNLFEVYEGVRIHAVPVFIRMPARLFKDDHYDRAARSIVQYVNANKELADADWLYAHFLTDNSYIGAKVKYALNMQLAAITRGDDVHAWPEQNPALINHIRYVFEHADLMLANNKGLARDALKFADKKIPDFKIAYNGINYADFAPRKLSEEEADGLRTKYGLPKGKKILICIAQSEFMKGWNELLEAVNECREELKDWVLLAVAGKHFSSFAIDVPEKVKALNLTNIVTVRDFAPHNEVKELYWLSNAFILPSYNEGISNAVMEALASGLWVITTDVGGHAEIMEDNVSGFLIEPKSKEAVKSSLRYLAQHYDERNETIGKQAVLAMQQLGSYVDNAQKLLSYFEQYKK